MTIILRRTVLSVRNVGTLRTFTTSPTYFKGPVETVKERAQDVNIKAGKTLSAGIEKAEEATESVKEGMGMKGKDAKEATDDAAHQASQAGKDLKNAASKAGSEVKHQAKKATS